MERARATGDGRAPAVAAAVVGALTLVGYVVLLLGEGDSPVRGRPLVFVVGIAVATAAAAAGAAARPGSGRGSRVALTLAAALFGVAGLLGIFSIGAPLIVAAVLAALAAGRDTRAEPHRPGDQPTR